MDKNKVTKFIRKTLHPSLLFIVLFAISWTKQNKNYLNSHGEEAQEKPPGL